MNWYRNENDIKEPNHIQVDCIFRIEDCNLHVDKRWLGVSERELDIINKFNMLNQIPHSKNCVPITWIKEFSVDNIIQPLDKYLEMEEERYA